MRMLKGPNKKFSIVKVWESGIQDRFKFSLKNSFEFKSTYQIRIMCWNRTGFKIYIKM